MKKHLRKFVSIIITILMFIPNGPVLADTVNEIKHAESATIETGEEILSEETKARCQSQEELDQNQKKDDRNKNIDDETTIEESELIEEELGTLGKKIDLSENNQQTDQPVSGVCGESVTWELNGDVLNIRGTGRMPDYRNNATGEAVLPVPWLSYQDTIQEIYVAEGITDLGIGTFYGLPNLVKVVLPSSLDEINEFAFAGCKNLSDVVIPESVVKINNRAFKDCSGLTTLLLPSGLKEIGAFAFQACGSIEDIIIPDQVSVMGTGVFQSCINLKKILLPETMTQLGAQIFEGCISLTEVTLPDKISDVGDNIFLGCISLISVGIPDSVTKIGNQAFFKCVSLTSIKIPDAVKSIGFEAFMGCSRLEAVIFNPSSQLANISWEAFRDCVQLKEIIMPNSLKGLSYGTFQGCKELEKITLPNQIEEIGYSTFEDCSKLAEIFLPNVLTRIQPNAFSNCSLLKSVKIPDGVIEIGMNAFSGCSSLEKIKLPKGITSVKSDTFNGCEKLQSIEWSNFIECIENRAFYECKALNSLSFETLSGLKMIGREAFWNCSSLTEVVLPESVENIGVGAFQRCANLTTVKLPNRIQTIESNTFGYCERLDKIEIPVEVTTIGEMAFYNCTALSEIVFSKGLKEIGSSSFEKCINLLSVQLPESLERIGSHSFRGCQNLKQINLPVTIIDIGENTFGECCNLEEIEWPGQIKKIQNSMFDSCINLKKVVLPDGLDEIGEKAFRGCESLIDISLPSTLSQIGNLAFEGCSSLDTVIIPNGMTSLESRVFAECKELSHLQLSNTLEKIGNSCFNGCEKLLEVEFPESLQYIGSMAFYHCSMKYCIIPPSVNEIGKFAFFSANVLGRQPIIIGKKESAAQNYAESSKVDFVDIVTLDFKTSNLQMKRNQTYELKLKGTPEYSTLNKFLPYNISNTDVITIENGIIKAQNAGQAVITVKLADKELNCMVTVSEVEVSEIMILTPNIAYNKHYNMEKGETQTWTIDYNPKDVTVPWTVNWSSTNDNVISVTNGRVTAKNPGTARITATAGQCSAYLDVTVSVPLKRISISPSEVNLAKYQNSYLNIVYDPADTTEKDSIIWSSTDESVVSVAQGRLTATGAGEAYITARRGALTATCRVCVYIPLSSVTINPKSVDLTEGQDTYLQISYGGVAEEDIAEIKWSSSAPDIAYCTTGSSIGIGHIFAIKPGTATITVEATAVGKEKRSIKSSCVVMVKEINYGNTVEGFVYRLYRLILNRKPDPSGLTTWTNLLYNKQSTGAEVALGFVNSREFTNRTISDSEYVELLYQAFMDRNSDSGGKRTWVNLLENGVSRLSVFKGFAESVEFDRICQKFGILRGAVNLTEPRDQNAQITMFVYRLYRVCLGRKAEVEGLNDWTRVLLEHHYDPKGVAKGFIFSRELQGRNLSPEDYVELHYQAFMGRKSDPSGKAAWVRLLREGMSKEELFWGFANSQEFGKIISSYGL